MLYIIEYKFLLILSEFNLNKERYTPQVVF